MGPADSVLYGVWFLFPGFYLIAMIYCKLEQVSGKRIRHNLKDYVHHMFFLLACALISILLDQYALADIAQSIYPDLIPLGFYRIILFPVVLLLGAKLLGGSKEIRIKKAPRVGDLTPRDKNRRKH